MTRRDPSLNHALTVALLDLSTWLGMYDRHAAVIECSDELIALLRGTNHTSTDRLLLSALTTRGATLMTLGREAEAESTLTEADALGRRVLGAAPSDVSAFIVGTNLLYLASVRENAGALPEAANMVQEALGFLRPLLGVPEMVGSNTVPTLIAQGETQLGRLGSGPPT